LLLSLGSRLHAHQLGYPDPFSHDPGGPFNPNTALEAQDSATVPHPSMSIHPIVTDPPPQQAQTSYDLLQRQISDLQLTMEGIQRPEKRARESTSFASQFDMSAEVSLPLRNFKRKLPWWPPTSLLQYSGRHLAPNRSSLTRHKLYHADLLYSSFNLWPQAVQLPHAPL
jgi:hypothetical protein